MRVTLDSGPPPGTSCINPFMKRWHQLFSLVVVLPVAGPASGQQTQVIAWGRNQTGINAVPASLTNAVAISSFGYFSIALRADGTVAAWGNGWTDPGVSNVVAISAGWVHALGLQTNGNVIGWGQNIDGDLNIPPGLTNPLALAAGWY